MYIDTVPNRNSKPAILLREGYREDGKVKKRTLANLSKLPPEAIEILKRVFKGESLISVEDSFEIIEDGSRLHGHVEAVMTAMRKLKVGQLISSRPCRERNLVLAMVAVRILDPCSKLATVESWQNTTLPELLDIGGANEDDLYSAMDWLLQRKSSIEKKLASRHLEQGGLALYDLTSSYFEGTSCPLAAFGHNRDGKKGKLQVNYGLLTNREGIPVSISIYEGNTGDPDTLMPQVEKVRNEFGIDRFVIVGDRGMLCQKQIDAIREVEGIDWIGALRPEAIKMLVTDGALQLGLFDERNMFELIHPDFPDERLIACRNEQLALKRANRRKSLIEATVKELEKVQAMVGSNRMLGKSAITQRVNIILKQYRVGKYYKVTAQGDGFDYSFDEQSMIDEVRDAYNDRPQEQLQKRLERYSKHRHQIEDRLTKVKQKIEKGQLGGKAAIGLRVGKVINKYKVGKHFNLDIKDESFDFEVDQEKVAREAKLDGIYIIRTSVREECLNAEQTVLGYKQLSQAERAFRSIKTVDLLIRPIHHHLADRVRAHIFLCMLAYYVQWHMIEALRPMTYADEEQEAKKKRDPVAPAKRSHSAQQKAKTKQRKDNQRVFSFTGLLKHMATIVRNKCRVPTAGKDTPTFDKDTPPNQIQREAFKRLQGIKL
jgi:transposase